MDGSKERAPSCNCTIVLAVTCSSNFEAGVWEWYDSCAIWNSLKERFQYTGTVNAVATLVPRLAQLGLATNSIAILEVGSLLCSHRQPLSFEVPVKTNSPKYTFSLPLFGRRRNEQGPWPDGGGDYPDRKVTCSFMFIGGCGAAFALECEQIPSVRPCRNNGEDIRKIEITRLTTTS